MVIIHQGEEHVRMARQYPEGKPHVENISQGVQLLDHYYDIRGWDKRGIPTRTTAQALGLEDEMKVVEKFTTLA
jgi:aldehyde:ferredoxin oxidoreductase